MSSSGYRGRNFGPRGARSNGPTNGFNGPRFLHPSFNHPRPPHRLPGPEKWIERPNFVPWQQSKNFLPHPQYRGNLQFRPNNRGRAAGGHGIVRFSGPGRPPAPQSCMGFIRNPISRAPLLQEEQVEIKSTLVPQTPLPGSEEERQQKISETADKLKQKLSSITEEEITNFWEDDLSVLPNNGSEEENTLNKGIPELRHEPPELDLTFSDFRDIGRVDCNNSKFETVDNKSNDESQSSFEQKPTDSSTSTNDEITIIYENKGETLISLNSTLDKDDLNQSIILLEDDKCHEQIHNELLNFECNVETIQLHDDNIAEGIIPSNLNDAGEKSSTSNLDENIANLTSIESVNDLTIEKSLVVNDIETSSISVPTTDSQNALQVDFSQDQNIVQTDIQNTIRDVIQDTNVDAHHNDYAETNLLEDNQIQNNLQTNDSQEMVCPNLSIISDSFQQKSFNIPPSNEEIHSNTICDSTSTAYSNYSEEHKLSDDKKLNNSPVFQSRVFNIPPRFTPRILGSRCRWTFQQNGKNLFFRGSQRLAFHGNRMAPSRHIAPVPVGFDPRAPPPFTHNVPVSSHDSQHNTLVPFSSIDLLPAFDPSEPPPNIRSKSVTEPCNRQENIQTTPSVDSRSQAVNNSQSNIQIMQPPPAFDPRGPPPRIPNVTTSEKLPEFNPQQPPPKIHKRNETLQPPPIFDPRLSSQERSNLIAPLNSSRSNMMSMNLMETSQVSDFNIGPVAPNFSQLPPMNIPSHQPFISNVHMNFQPVLPQTNSGQQIMSEFALPPPPINVTEVPPPPPTELSVESNSNLNQSINMDDGLEDMQEAMEFAKQIMNMSEEIKNENVSSMLSELPLAPSEIPVPNETVPYSSLIEEVPINTTRKQRRKESKNKKSKQNIVCGPEFILERQEEIVTIDEEQNVQNQSKNTEDTLLSNDQIRPKVVFNLNSKTKKIQKPEEWHRIPINISENRETSQQGAVQNSNKEKAQTKRHSSESRRSNTNQNKSQQKESSVKMNSVHCASVINISMHEKSNDTSYHKDHSRDLEKLHPHSSNTPDSNNTNTQKNQKTKKESRKLEAPTSESSWKNRVINRFLKMSKNDICNMVNNSSLRKFDIAMKHLVKERKTSLSLEMRNTEDEKMKEYDREEFMNQLNAMLDPSAVVGITDLPTEFIHHLSEVLQLDPMPFDAELSENQTAGVDEITTKIIFNQDENSRIHICDFSNEENAKVQSFTEYSEPQNICEELVENKLLYKEDLIHYPLNSELNLNISREDTNSSQRSLSNKINPEVENTHKKQQQPLFNEADLDDILSEVTERTKNLPNTISSLGLDKSIETRTGSSLPQTVTEAFEYNTFSQIPNKTAADLDDIFSAGIARVKLLGKSNVDSDNLRARKSSSEDRNTFRPERYERWNRKEREDPDAFRNLTKEEWEAKYGLTTNVTTTPIITRKSASNSVENLTKDNRSLHAQRYCSSDSPMRHLSISPLTRESSMHNVDRSTTSRSNEIEELQRVERSESSTDSSTSSSSDSDEETVAPNVTKLLKVIKEKEKIAKKKSLNETIRDEVAAEIEKKWKEKSKHKERKFRKREKRKKDKREKRKKEKKKKKKRNSHSDSSKCSEQIEGGFRLLTEDEIKKEVVVKEEPVNSFEESVSFNSGASNTCVVPTSVNSKAADLRIESQSSNIEIDQVPAVTCDTVLSQIKSKPPVIVTMMQPKTKAQLKQMPESTNIEQRQLMEKSTEIAKDNGIMSINNDRMKDFLDTNKDDKTANNSNEQIDTVSSMNISLYQTNVSLNIKEPFSSIQSLIETVSDNTTAHATSFINLSAEINASNQSTDQKMLQIATKASSVENKSGNYKKIDIKAYKERALQRRLKEQSMLKETPEDLASLTRDLHLVLPVSETTVEPLSALNEIKITEIDTNKIQLKDPRLARRSSSAHTLADSNKEVKERSNSEGDYQSVDIVQKNKESSVVVQLKNVNEKSVTQLVDSDLNTLKDLSKCKERKSDSKSLSQEVVVESSKFKNIRSEGSKELKLKKEKAKKLMEKKRKKSYDPLVAEKHVEKYSHKKVSSEGNQESLVVMTEIEKTNSRDIHEDLSKIMTSEMCSKSEFIIDDRSIQEQANVHSILELDKQNSNETILDNQQVADEEKTQNKDDLNFVNSENGKDSIKETEKDIIKIVEMETSSEPISIENLNKKKDVCKDMSVGLISLDSAQTIFTEKCIESTVSLITDCVSEESRSLSEHTDVDVRKSVHLVNIESLKNVIIHDNSTLDTEMDSDIDSKCNNINVETNDMQEQDKNKITSESHEDLKDSGSKIIESETQSPESPNSPFKGFLADSIENDTCQVSEMYKVKASSISGKENVKKNSKQWLDTCLNNKLTLESQQDNKDIDESSNRKNEDNETKSICRLMEEQQGISISNVANETTGNTLHVLDNIEVATTTLTTENRDITGKNDQAYNAFSEQRNTSPMIDINSHNSTVFDDGEPFIVLDEYIDDADGKSIEKLSALDLDFEDCIARDADIFTNKSLAEEERSTNDIKSPNFNSIDFKELSEVFDKENIDKEQNQSTITAINESEEIVLPEENTVPPTKLFVSEEGSINATDVVFSTFESNSESNSKITKIVKLIDSTVSEIPIESSENIISTMSKDISQRSLTPELSYTDTGRTKEGNLHCAYISKNNLQDNSESSSTAKMGVTLLETDTSLKSSAPIETAMKSSLENFSVTESMQSEEFLELNKQTYDCEQKNLQKSNDNLVNKLNLIPSEARMSSDKDASFDSTAGQKTLKYSNKTTSNNPNQREADEMLHKIKNKSRMKHKKQKRTISEKTVKEVMKSDTVKVKYPSTKEAIMARMIEIDVEIHKLMTEKMTLYQMLTSDALPSDNNLQQNNITHEEKEIETPVVRPRTPSALMSQLIQNIETSPVTNQCAKITTENVSTKDSTINSEQPNKSKTLPRNEHQTEKKGSSTSTCGSDDEETMHHTKSSISRKRKRQRSERTPKHLENKSDCSVSSKDTQIIEKKQVNDATKVTSRKINTRQTIIEQDSSQVSINENKSQKDKISTQQIDKEDLYNNDKIEMLKNEEVEKSIECAKSQTSAEEIIEANVTEVNEESCLTKDNEVKTETSKEGAISAVKSQENKTPERSSIYSDDSTWDSLLQNSSMDDQKKPNTGLALLEETYKKEMAKTRKIKAEARKKKKKRLHNLLQAVNTLTPEEEELPLSALYIKKLHQKRKLLNSLEYQAKQQVSDDPELWKNVVEVINAVAENRTEELYVEQLQEQLTGDTEGTTSDILEENSDSKENKEKQIVDSLILKNTEEICIDLSVDVKTSCENKDTTNNELKKDNVQLSPSKSQECLSNEYFQKDLEISASSKLVEDISGTSVCEISTNIEENLTEFSAQEALENDNVEINQLTSIDDVDSCCMELDSSNICSDQNTLNTLENPPTKNLEEDKVEVENEELNLQEKICNVEEDIAAQAPANSQSVVTLENVEKSQDDATEYNNDKNTSITSEISSNGDSDFEMGGINEEKLKDSKVSCERDNNEDDTTEKSSCTPQDEQFISLKEHKESQKRKETERLNKDPSEENNNQNSASVSSTSESTDTLKSEETSSKKSSKRKSSSSRTPLRRSSRYTEEYTKRIKLEVDVSVQNIEQESQEKNLKMQFPSISTISLSSCEDEVETIWINPRKSRGTQKVTSSKKRCTPMSLEIEILHESNLNNEPIKGIKRYKQHTISEMMNCVVKLADCKDAILNPNKSPNTIQKYGISEITKCVCPNSTQLDPFITSMQSTSTKDLSSVCLKETTSVTEFSPSQTSKLIKKFEDAMRPVNDQITFTKVKKTLKPGRIDSPAIDKEEHADPDIEVMPVLIKEPVTVDTSQNYEKPDIEIIEEKMIVTKSQQHSNSGSTLTVIDTKDDKEVPRTQYTVHKGPILDIKIFENSFLAASEDGRVYRYNQASNGILNIYKGHKAAVTCLYVYNANSTDINKEWMFSGSLDGTLRCYNIMTGVQARETADIGSPIQCMDEAWGIIFIGTKSGHVSRYHMKSGIIKGNSIQFSDKSVLALKATNEGPRRVLIVASRSQPITIRDAQSGLFLRTICGQKNHTVYSLMRDHNLIYCGTSSTSIPVFDFTNGEQTMQYDAGVGIVCMRLYRQLLFAGCYDGNIYVFDTKDHRLVCSIPGPGNMLLSMEVIDNKIIAGSKDKRLQSWQMPRQVRTLL